MDDDFISKVLHYDQLKECIETAFKFYSQFEEVDKLKQNFKLSLNDKHNRWRLGSFSRKDSHIEIFDLSKQLEDSTLTAVLVHELAHFLDNTRKEGRLSFASSKHNTPEHELVVEYMQNMEPVPEKSTNYRGRRCEIFARSIEQYYCITNNIMPEQLKSDLYVQEETFKQKILEKVQKYIRTGGKSIN